MLILILFFLVFAMIAGSILLATRLLPPGSQRSLAPPEQAALERRIRALEESLERTDARLARVEEAEEFTTKLLSDRPRPPEALPGVTGGTAGPGSAVSVDEFLRYASGLEHERLATAGGRAQFTLRAVPRGLEITPESSSQPRVVGRETIQLVLDEYERSRNLQPDQYQGITSDASYLLAIVARYHHDHHPL